MEAAPIRRTEGHFPGGGRRTLHRRSWVAPFPERALALVHGYAEHSGRYEHVGRWLAERGCAVHAFDQQGHGRSDGRRGHVRRLDDLLDDIATLVEQVRSEHPDLPLHLVGHSMGGLEVAVFLSRRRPVLASAVLSGAALRVPDPPPAHQRLALRLLKPLVPRLSIPRPIALDALSRDPEVGRAYAADPLVFQTMTLSLATALFDAGPQALRGAGEVAVPVLVLHGGDDPICAPSGSRDFHARLARPESELRIYPGLRHEIFNEPEHEQVLADVLDWLRKREASDVR